MTLLFTDQTLKRQHFCSDSRTPPDLYQSNAASDENSSTHNENQNGPLNNTSSHSQAPTEGPSSRVLRSKENQPSSHVPSTENCQRSSIIDGKDSLEERMENHGKENCALPENDVESGREKAHPEDDTVKPF